MATIRCSNCNLVNFGTEVQCKRCKQPLPELANIADQRQYQADFNQNFQNQPSHFQSYQMPPPPDLYENQHQPTLQQMSCIKCGNRNNVSMRNFKKDYISPVSYLGFFLGVLPGILLMALLKTRHNINAPFCIECWQKFSRISIREALGALGVLGGLFVGLVVLGLFESFFLMLLCFAFGFGLLIYSQFYRSKHSPKYKKVTRKEVVITDPIYGDVSFAR